MTRLLPVTMMALVGLTMGCGPSQDELDAELARVRDLTEQLREAQAQREALEARLEGIEAQNTEMAARLRALGEEVQGLEGDRESLQNTLGETRRALEQLRERERQARARMETFRNMLQRLRSLIQGGRLAVDIRYGRMVVVLQENILFASGQARLKREGRATLDELAVILNDIPGRQFQVTGHTDNVPIRRGRYRSNWHLSTTRAVNVTQRLIDAGMDAGRLSAAGYADTQPIPNNTNATPEERQANRRIEIVIVFNVDELPDLTALDQLT